VLEADDQIVRGAVALLVRGDEHLAELGQIRFVPLDNDELVGIGPAIGPHRHGLATEDQLGAWPTFMGCL